MVHSTSNNGKVPRCINVVVYSMESVSLYSRAWDTIEEELEYASETLSRYGRDGRADDVMYTLRQVRKQRESGEDPEGADLGRYEERMRDTL